MRNIDIKFIRDLLEGELKFFLDKVTSDTDVKIDFNKSKKLFSE